LDIKYCENKNDERRIGMSKKIILLVGTLFIALNFISCYKGSDIPGRPDAGQVISGGQSVSGTQTGNNGNTQVNQNGQTGVSDSDVVKNKAQELINTVNAGITTVEAGQKLVQDLKELLPQVKSAELIKAIEDAIKKAEEAIAAIKAKQDAASAVNQLVVSTNGLLANIASIALKLDTLENVNSTIKSLTDALAALQAQETLINNLINLLKGDPANVELVKVLKDLLAKVIAKEKAIQASLEQAIAKKNELTQAALKETWTAEFNTLNAQFGAISAEVNQTLAQLQNLLAQKEAIEAQINNGTVNNALLTQLQSIETQLAAFDTAKLQAQLETLAALEEKAAALVEKTQGQLPQASVLLSQVQALENKIQTALTNLSQAITEIPELKAAIAAKIEENDQNGNDSDVVPGNGGQITEKMLKTLIKFKNGEIIFYHVSYKWGYKDVNHWKLVKQNGKYQWVKETKTIKYKKYGKVPYKKWKVSFDVKWTLQGLQVTIHIAQALSNDGGASWTAYTHFTSINLRDFLHHFFHWK